MTNNKAETLESIVNGNVWAAIDQRNDRKNYASVTEVIAAYLQNTMDTCREYKINASCEAIYGAFCRELADAWKGLVSSTERLPDGFRVYGK